MSTTSNDPAQLLASLLKGGQSIFANAAATNDAAAAGSDATRPVDPVSVFIAFTKQMAQAQQQQFVDQMRGLWTGTSGEFAAAPTAAMDGDKRFIAEAWRNDPCFRGRSRAFPWTTRPKRRCVTGCVSLSTQ
jgi:hypothetical protein